MGLAKNRKHLLLIGNNATKKYDALVFVSLTSGFFMFDRVNYIFYLLETIYDKGYVAYDFKFKTANLNDSA